MPSMFIVYLKKLKSYFIINIFICDIFYSIANGKSIKYIKLLACGSKSCGNSGQYTLLGWGLTYDDARK
jgi:hypothetical protein